MSAPRSVELTARELGALLKPVFPLVGTDDYLPVLTAIHLSVRDGYLIAQATDRFRLGMCRHKLEDQGTPELEALVLARDLKRVLQLFKPTRNVDPVLRFKVRAESGTLEVTNLAAFDGLLEAVVTFPTLDASFPDVRKLLVDVMQLETSGEVRAFNPRFLAAFAAAQRSAGDVLVLRQATPGKPLVVTCGEHFVGALMPVRTRGAEVDNATTEHQEALVSWRELILPKAVSA